VLRSHSDRLRLAEEIHSRPQPEITTPARLSRLAVLVDRDGDAAWQEAVGELSRRYGAPPPHRERYHEAELGAFALRFERHTEFVSLTLIWPGLGGEPFVKSPLELLPADWLEALPGELIAAAHLVIEPAAMPRDLEAVERLFEGQRLVASLLMGGAAELWTDWRTHGDGFVRFLIRDHALGAARAGRIVQRVLELDTYRMMALLGLPFARAQAAGLSAFEERLAALAAALGEARDAGAEWNRLHELLTLAAEVERKLAASAFRFGATRAYRQLVLERLEGLFEQRLGDLQPVGDFLRVRFEPAIRTSESVAARLDALSQRIARTADLARTRVDVELERQNQQLLASMERRAALQLRLQETVEGLSVVAISYYLVGLLGYVLKGAKLAGVHEVAIEGVLAIIVPLAMATVWLGVRRLRRRVRRDRSGAGDEVGVSGRV
jgi:uncharacterized membrane-anchored protein